MYLPKTPLLTAHQETELSRTVEAGLLAAEVLGGDAQALGGYASRAELEALVESGREAEAEFVTANLRLVRLISLRIALRTSLSDDDLFQEGCCALTEAVRRFDPDRRVRFASFAYPWIQAKVLAAVGDHRAIRRPRQATAPMPSLIRLDEVELPGADDSRLEDLERDRVDLTAVLAELDQRCRQIVLMRFGLNGHRACTLRTIAQELGLSKATVRRAEERALAVLRRRLARDGIGSPEAVRVGPMTPLGRVA